MTTASLFDDEPAEPPPEPKPAGKPKARAMRDLPPPLSESFEAPKVRFPHPERDVAARLLEEFFEDYAQHRATEDELLRFVRGSLYPLDPDELLQLGNRLVNILRGNEE